jgi:hypothetical protein
MMDIRALWSDVSDAHNTEINKEIDVMKGQQAEKPSTEAELERQSPDEPWLEPIVVEHKGLTGRVCRYCAGMYGIRGMTRKDVFLDDGAFLRHLLEEHGRGPSA